MDALFNTRAGSERASRRKKRGEAAVDFCADFGLLKKTRLEDGFLVQGTNIIPELKTAFISAPAGLITVFGTKKGTIFCESDNYAGAVYYNGITYGADYLLKQFLADGTGQDTNVTILLQGQREADILNAAPYYNTVEYQFNGTLSYYELDPGKILNQDSYTYHDSWHTPSVFPVGQAEQAFVGLAGRYLLYQEFSSFSSELEIRLSGHLSNGEQISGRTSFFDQYFHSVSPTRSVWPQPVSSGYMAISPVEFLFYPLDSGNKYYATAIKQIDGVLSYDRVYLDSILHDPLSIPTSHTGPVMPTELRDIILGDPQIVCRPGFFYCFSPALDAGPLLFNVIDITGTDNSFISIGADRNYFKDNPSQRKWRLSCHFHDTETGETWSFHAEQFWPLLRERVINLEIIESLEDAPSTQFNIDGWSAANNVLRQFFGRPNNSFSVPHDTWMFHAEFGSLYTWTRYYGNIEIRRDGIFGLDPADIIVPAIISTGIRPTIRYSGDRKNPDDPFGFPVAGRYTCVCEKLERLHPDENLPQGQKEILGIYVGTPFSPAAWEPIPVFEIDRDGETWSLCHVRVAYHEVAGSYSDTLFEEKILLLGIARRMFIDVKTLEEVINYYSVYMHYSYANGGKWSIAGRYNVDTGDSVYGERWSADMCLFGDSVLTPKMMKYMSPPQGASQFPCGPYDGYERGLP